MNHYLLRPHLTFIQDLKEPYPLGMRFGLLQTKLGIYTLIRKYKVIPAEETPKRLNFLPSTLVTSTDQPIQLIIQPRND
ncbi:hypothetical protein O3M35_007767 [Rhynocoris fuscipes]|uniref:Cytochrome P450 n=1 Tax=Rhynocoris fuscipes TaxID=488301 RepID=A0AAW1DBC9_9HEMI